MVAIDILCTIPLTLVQYYSTYHKYYLLTRCDVGMNTVPDLVDSTRHCVKLSAGLVGTLLLVLGFMPKLT